jgi:hypothetical protein
MVRKSRKVVEEKKKDPNTVYVHVLYTQWSEGGEAESEERFSNRSDETTSTTFKGAVVSAEEYSDLSSVDHSMSKQTFPAPRAAFEESRALIYAVVGYYSDGDTFGHSYGNMFIVDVYGNLEKANAVAEQLRRDDDAGTKDKHSSIFGDSNRYIPWGGYFSRLERIEVQVLHILQLSMNPADSSKEPPKNLNDIPSW